MIVHPVTGEVYERADVVRIIGCDRGTFGTVLTLRDGRHVEIPMGISRARKALQCEDAPNILDFSATFAGKKGRKS